MRGRDRCLFEEGVLDRQQRRAAERRRLSGRGLSVFFQALCDLGQAGDGLLLEQVFGGEAQALGAGAADQLDGEDGVAAQFEEVVVDADRRPAEQVLPEGRQHRFGRGGGGLRRGAGRACGRRQGAAVDFAVRGARQLRQPNVVGRDQVVGQARGQGGFELGVGGGRGGGAWRGASSGAAVPPAR